MKASIQVIAVLIIIQGFFLEYISRKNKLRLSLPFSLISIAVAALTKEMYLLVVVLAVFFVGVRLLWKNYFDLVTLLSIVFYHLVLLCFKDAALSIVLSFVIFLLFMALVFIRARDERYRS